jgi:hypothetical protein
LGTFVVGGCATHSLSCAFVGVGEWLNVSYELLESDKSISVEIHLEQRYDPAAVHTGTYPLEHRYTRSI